MYSVKRQRIDCQARARASVRRVLGAVGRAKETHTLRRPSPRCAAHAAASAHQSKHAREYHSMTRRRAIHARTGVRAGRLSRAAVSKSSASSSIHAYARQHVSTAARAAPQLRLSDTRSSASKLCQPAKNSARITHQRLLRGRSAAAPPAGGGLPGGKYTRPRCLYVVARGRLPSSRRSARESTVRVFASLRVCVEHLTTCCRSDASGSCQSSSRACKAHDRSTAKRRCWRRRLQAWKA